MAQLLFKIKLHWRNLKLNTPKMTGVRMLLKSFGAIYFGEGINKVKWVWDYANDIPRREIDMTKDEILNSERAKYQSLKQE